MPVDASQLRLVIYPAPVLRTRAKPIKAVTDEVREVARAMIDLMRKEEGIGLAAPQVGLDWRLFVVDVPKDDKRVKHAEFPTASDGPVVYINPVISAPQGGVEPHEEGCLSLPDVRGDVLRPPTVTIAALDLQGKPFTQTGTGLLARCWQHELDHLDGVLILDRMIQAHRIKNRSIVRDLERDAEQA
jgi:peptide deformylase